MLTLVLNQRFVLFCFVQFSCGKSASHKTALSIHKTVLNHLKKTFVIALLFVFLFSCGNNKTISKIENYVTQINNRTDLIESITEFNTEDLNDKIVGGISIYKLADEKGGIYRMTAEIVRNNGAPANYEFYFKKDTLTFARIIEFDETGNDTIINSEYYFQGKKLLKQLNKQENKMDATTVKEVSEFYFVYGKTKRK